MRVLAVLPAVSVVLAGCVTYESSPRGADSAAAPAAAAPAAAPAAPAAPADPAPPRASGGATMDTTLTGTVREQIPVGPYVYLRLETTGGETWAAVAAAPVTTGRPVTVYNAMAMDAFTSPSLKRTFDRIWFGSLTKNGGAPGTAGVPSAAPAPAGPPPAPIGDASAGSGTPPVVDAKVGRIARAAGDDARSVAELWAQKDRAAGWTVSVRGVVVRYNAGVMGRNWLHLQDGTGDVRAGTRELTVTSSATAAVGDTVTVTGRVSVNKDFGAGYRYGVIVENASVR